MPTDMFDDDYQKRKEQRRKQYQSQLGKKLVYCTACSGSGYYDNYGSPACGGCNGTGRTRQR